MLENFYHNHQVAAALFTVIILAWVPGNHLQIWRRLQGRLPLFTALIDLFFAPLTVVLFFTIVMIALGPDFSPGQEQWLTGIFYLFLCLITSWFVAKGGYAFVSHCYIGERSSRPQSLPGLLRSVIYGAALIIGVGFFLWMQGYSLTGIWISTGLLTALIAFSLQQTLGDFFSGLALGLEGSFRIGDWLQLENGT